MTDRYAVYCELLAAPDLPCLPPRRRRYVYAGDPLRRDGLKRDFERAYVRWRVIDAGRAESSIVSLRRSPILRIVREGKRA